MTFIKKEGRSLTKAEVKETSAKFAAAVKLCQERLKAWETPTPGVDQETNWMACACAEVYFAKWGSRCSDQEWYDAIFQMAADLAIK